VTGWQEGAGSRKGRGRHRHWGWDPDWDWDWDRDRDGEGLTGGPLGSAMLKKFDKKDEESGEGRPGGAGP